MRFLQWFGQDIAAGKGKALALETRIGRQHHHVANLLGRFQGQGPLALGGNAEGAKFKPRRPLANAEFDPAVGQQIQRRQALGRAGGVIVIRYDLADAMAQADILGQPGGGGQKHFRRRGVGIFIQEMMLHLPGMIEAKPVGKNDLFQRFLEQTVLVALVPGAGQLQLVKHTETHGGCLL